MFIYLSKKIAIPNGVKLKSISWNTEQGWIACGGDQGMLKVLKLETQPCAELGKRGVAAPSNLSMNQTLDGHSGGVMCVTWNATYQKLTTSDEAGLIIVWMLHKGMWFEEMINNRNKSVVRDMQWNADGQKICICYEDGAVIVGSVHGDRLWGSELKMELMFVAWSPDGRQIVFVTTDSDVNIFDNKGNKIRQMRLPLLDKMPDARPNIIAIHWYDGMEGHISPDAPTLAIAFGGGHVQLSRHASDENPVLLDTEMALTQARWNANGSVLAVSGSQVTQLPSGEEKEVSMVRFYTPHGVHIRTLKIPGRGITALTWEGSGLRIALAVESYIYFANLRPDYRWGHFSNTLVFSFNRPGRDEQCVVFWDTRADERYMKYFARLLEIRAAGDNCVLLRKSGPDPPGGAPRAGGEHTLVLCNAIGAPVDTKTIDFKPTHLTMTQYHVVAASAHAVYVWQYRTQISKLTSVEASDKSLRRREGRERVFHVDDPASQGAATLETFRGYNTSTSDAIAGITANDTCLIVARRSGAMQRYSLPHISLENIFTAQCEPDAVAVNCDGTKLSIIDTKGTLSFFDMEAGAHGGDKPAGEHVAGHERKDVWDMAWAEDNPSMLVCMEKMRMMVLRNYEPEEPIQTSGYICSFKDLTVKSAMLDEVMESPLDFPQDVLLEFETKALREAREMLADVGVRETLAVVEQQAVEAGEGSGSSLPGGGGDAAAGGGMEGGGALSKGAGRGAGSAPHPKLWRLLAEAALEELNLGCAEQAFVRCADYEGILFVKELRALDDRMKQKAEVAAFFGRFDEAETLLREIDRKDLAIELRMRLGDWFRVVQLVQSGGGDDRMLTLAWNRLGDYHAARQDWVSAAAHYAKAKNSSALVHCYYLLEQFPQLERVARSLPDSSAAILIDCATKLQSVGLCDAACDAYVRAGEPKRAIDCCVLLNRWGRAVSLSEEHGFPQIEGLLSKYVAQLLERRRVISAVELYRAANKSPEAAKLLARLARAEGSEKRDLLRAKKLQVLAALEVERFRKRVLDTQTTAASGQTAAQTTAATLANLMTHDSTSTSVGGAGGDKEDARVLDAAWRGAEAYHFLMLAQRQLYAARYTAAMKTALRLAEYEDVLDAREIYSLIALASYYSKHFAVCSTAFCRLESLTTLSTAEREEVGELALQIFTRHKPVDAASRGGPDGSYTADCRCEQCGNNSVKPWHTSCENCGTKFKPCVVTGASLVWPEARHEDERPGVYTCKTCRHDAIIDELRGFANCPLCHAMLDEKQLGNYKAGQTQMLFNKDLSY